MGSDGAEDIDDGRHGAFSFFARTRSGSRNGIRRALVRPHRCGQSAPRPGVPAPPVWEEPGKKQPSAIGEAALALIFYFVVRGGLLSTGAAASDMSAFGVAAVAGLVGMFSKQATDKLRELFDNLFRTEQGKGDDARADKLGANLPVTSGMIERRKIAAFAIREGDSEADVRVVDLHLMLGGVVTRIPVLDHADVPVCVIHQSLIYKFLADRSIDAMKAKQPFDAERYTLKDLLAASGMKELVQDSLAYVAKGAMLSDAKERMDRTPNCQDIFVTEHGQAGEPVLGWLTDTEVRRAARV